MRVQIRVSRPLVRARTAPAPCRVTERLQNHAEMLQLHHKGAVREKQGRTLKSEEILCREGAVVNRHALPRLVVGHDECQDLLVCDVGVAQVELEGSVAVERKRGRNFEDGGSESGLETEHEAHDHVGATVDVRLHRACMALHISPASTVQPLSPPWITVLPHKRLLAGLLHWREGCGVVTTLGSSGRAVSNAHARSGGARMHTEPSTPIGPLQAKPPLHAWASVQHGSPSLLQPNEEDPAHVGASCLIEQFCFDQASRLYREATGARNQVLVQVLFPPRSSERAVSCHNKITAR